MSAVVGFNPTLLNVTWASLRTVNVLASALLSTPPPVKYLTVRVVFEGAIP